MKRCLTCHIKTKGFGLRCKSCCRKGKLNPQYVSGKYINFPKCKDCGKGLQNYKAKRCRRCHISNLNKNRWKNKEFRNKMISILSLKAKKRLANPKNNPNWKGGKQAKVRPRHTTKYKIWRLAVFKRDKYTCKICNRKGCQLEAHHIKSWTFYPKLRFKVSNGKTLCWKCHHKKGYKLK